MVLSFNLTNPLGSSRFFGFAIAYAIVTSVILWWCCGCSPREWQFWFILVIVLPTFPCWFPLYIVYCLCSDSNNNDSGERWELVGVFRRVKS